MFRRHDDGAVDVGMDERVGARVEPGDVHLAVEIGPVEVGAVGREAAVERLEALRHAGDIADGAVGDEADTAERAVHEAHDLAEERVGRGMGRVAVLHHDDAGLRAGGNIVEPGEVLRLLGFGIEAAGLHRAVERGAREAHHGRQIGPRAVKHRLGRAPRRLGRHGQQRVADGRRVVAAERREIDVVSGHGALPALS